MIHQAYAELSTYSRCKAFGGVSWPACRWVTGLPRGITCAVSVSIVLVPIALAGIATWQASRRIQDAQGKSFWVTVVLNVRRRERVQQLLHVGTFQGRFLDLDEVVALAQACRGQREESARRRFATFS
jgi:hypothetical protein